MRRWRVLTGVLFLVSAWTVRAGAQTPVDLVDPFVGTSGTQIGGPIDTFPGADVPFGMVQWSPDTPSQNAGGGYEYGDRAITGFSLTHLSGPGCNVFGDFAFLPTTGAIGDPAGARQPFSHDGEEASPGWYAVSLGSPAIRTELTVTPRSGIARFTFPATPQANVLVNVASNQAGVTDAGVRVDSGDEISGWASSGFFCGMPDRYTVYFVARFDRPFASYGTWRNAYVAPGTATSGGPQSGAYVTFDAASDPQVLVKVGLSFVSVAGARANLDAEDRGWDVDAIRNRAAASWQTYLGRIAVRGGTTGQQHTFYTALYHTLLHPNLVSDADGRYTGFDGKVHRVAPGHSEYANFSDWDIYRTEIPLLALIAPGETSDMMQSLVDAYRQEGWLPRWPLVNGPTSVMGGDSIDPVIAGAYAFGARDFDVRTALAAMVKGATTAAGPPAQGWYVERWELDDDYLRRGFVVNTHTTSVAPVPNGASETLEYALDDFSIARFARAIGDAAVARRFLQRSSNWATLFDTATGLIAPRDPDGAFMNAGIGENGQSGFQEGNAAQYTWMVPQDLRDLISGMGGDGAAVRRLDTFFSQLNADQDKPYAWLGNEPSLGSPWVYLSAGEPWRTQSIVRQAISTLYDDTPSGIPGNDDLGTMSAWYVWCAIGLYPQNPSVRAFDVGSPLFSGVTITAPAGGPTIDVEAPNAATAAPYVRGLRVNGAPAQSTWLALPAHRNLRLDFDLATTADTTWGTDPSDAPPSYAARTLTFPPATAARFVGPAEIRLAAGGSAAAQIQVDDTGGDATVVSWHADAVPGLRVIPQSGTVDVAAGAKISIAVRLEADATDGAGYYDARIYGAATDGAVLEHAVAVARVTGGSAHPIAFAVNRFGDSVTPVDLETGSTGPEIPTHGDQSRDAALSSDGTRLYVANDASNTISVIDTVGEKTIATIKTGNGPNGVRLTADGRTLWFANSGDGTIESIDTATGRVSAPIAVGTNPRDVAITPDGTTVFVSLTGDNAVVPVDVATRSVQPAIAAGERPALMAMGPGGKRLYVAGMASNDVTPLDVVARRALTPIPAGIMPVAIAISPDGRVAYVTDYGNSLVTPIDLATGKAGPAIHAGGAPYGVVFFAGGRSAAVIARRDNACVVVDVATGRVSPPIPLGNGPYTIVAP
ncbi:MAG TPA: GH92 family glycosyl hydrolase [Candidatus Acidoferrales bacterium]|nr:GH92 family glycosyl hydrolase [Candidatus Acidoferrales bacterium]